MQPGEVRLSSDADEIRILAGRAECVVPPRCTSNSSRIAENGDSTLASHTLWSTCVDVYGGWARGCDPREHRSDEVGAGP